MRERPDKERKKMAKTLTDQRPLAPLEGLRAMAGETRRSELETLPPDNPPSPMSTIANRKGSPATTSEGRIAFHDFADPGTRSKAGCTGSSQNS